MLVSVMMKVEGICAELKKILKDACILCVVIGIAIPAAMLGKAMSKLWITCLLWIVLDVLLCSALTIRWLRHCVSKRINGQVEMFHGICTAALASIVGFSVFYYYGGLTQASGEVIHSAKIGSYFSLVTWTSVGYGDYYPAAETRFVAGIEAVAGYMWMALLAGFFMQFLGAPLVKLLGSASELPNPRESQDESIDMRSQ